MGGSDAVGRRLLTTASSALEVRILGDPHVSYDGRTVRFSAARTLPLFVYLMLHRERPVARDLLAYTFWPDESENDARANLRRHLHRLNQALPAVADFAWLVVDKKSVAVNPAAPIELDVARLEAACAGKAVPESVLDLYAGDLYQGCDEDWILALRERLRAGYLDLASQLIGRYRGERRYAEAVAIAQRMLAIDPFREDTVRIAMSLHYEAGDRAGALREFETFRHRLGTDVGAEPMLETLSLRDAIRRHAALEPHEAEPGASPERALPFGGRVAELDALRRVWRGAARGKGGAAVVCGEAGIGKTRLVREFSTIAEREGARVLWGGTSSPEATPYEAVTEALRFATTEIATLALPPALLSALTVRFPELRALRGDLPESVALLDDRERSRFFDAVGLAVAALATARPTVLVVEDLHWAREGTLELLLTILRTCRASPVLALLTYREEEAGPPLRRLLRDPELRPAVRLGIARLAQHECESILAEGFGAGLLPERVAQWAARLSGGNPLFLSELAREYRPRADGADVEPDGLPPSLESTILARLARVSEAARNVAGFAAVAGANFAVDVVHRASGWPLAEILDALDELVDGFIVRETVAGSHGDYQFTHELIRDAVLAHMPGDTAVRRHRRVARALLEIYPDREGELARTLAEHFEKAGLARESAVYFARAARVALAEFAWPEAVALARRSLDLDAASDARFEVLACLASAHERQGNRDDQQATIDAMLRLADGREDDALRAVALARHAEAAFQRADDAREREAIAALTALALRTGEPRHLREARRADTRRLIHDGRPEEALQTIASVDDIAGLQRSPAERVADLCLLAHVAAVAAAFERSREAVLAAEVLAERDGGPAERIAVLRARLTLAVERSDREETARRAPLLLELCRQIGDVEGAGNAHQMIARATWWSFDVASTRAHLRDGIAIFERIGKPRSLAAIENNAGALENHVGQLDAAAAHYARARSCAVELGSSHQLAINHLNLAYLAYSRGDARTALTQADLAIEAAREDRNRRFEATGLAHRATALRELQRFDEACEDFSAALAICEKFGFADERLETLAEMLPVLVARGELERARTVAEELITTIAADPGALAMPVDALAKAADAQAAAGDTMGATATRDRAGDLLRTRLARLPDEPTRAAYAALRWHRPFADPSLGRSLDARTLR
jgi:DNA-binding SARP family transcriptional activator